MAQNIIYKPGYELSVVVTHPASPESGDPIRYGVLTGIALTDEGEGGNISTETSCNFGPFIADIPVVAEASAIAEGDPLFYDDAIGGVNNDAVNGYYYGIAREAIANGQTDTINVLHTPSPGAGTLADGSVTEAKLAAASLTGLVAKVVADDNVIGGLTVLHRIDVPDGSGDTDVVLTHKTRVIDAWAVNTGIAAHASTDTWQVLNGSNAISDAVAKTATVNALTRIGTIDPAEAEIAAAGTLKITAAKTTNSAVTVYVLGIRVP